MEAYSANHSETIEELLEWPYRRFMQAFADWQRRNAVDELENRKNLHVAALYTITEWKEAGDQSIAVEEVEEFYETLKDQVWNPTEIIKESEISEDDPFFAAGKRSLNRVLSAHQKAEIIPAEMPNQKEIEDLLG